MSMKNADVAAGQWILAIMLALDFAGWNAGARASGQFDWFASLSNSPSAANVADWVLTSVRIAVIVAPSAIAFLEAVRRTQLRSPGGHDVSTLACGRCSAQPPALTVAAENRSLVMGASRAGARYVRFYG